MLPFPTSAKLLFEVPSGINLVEGLGSQTLQMCVLTSSYCYITAVFREQMEQLFPLIMFHPSISEQPQSWKERVKEFVLAHTFYRKWQKSTLQVALHIQ